MERMKAVHLDKDIQLVRHGSPTSYLCEGETKDLRCLEDDPENSRVWITTETERFWVHASHVRKGVPAPRREPELALNNRIGGRRPSPAEAAAAAINQRSSEQLKK